LALGSITEMISSGSQEIINETIAVEGIPLQINGNLGTPIEGMAVAVVAMVKGTEYPLL
jgi:hypothetical protein